uniref:Reverse transcriptase Ty1/copia-type domain-containing protein n=1 Tax=Vitis vinifera TaxID=29760 RepID=A5BW25_VITVI|nr:hypothetical protein VITISV_019573 [Vitis vinifera]
MSQHGIIHQSSCAHTPQQNGVAERKNRHLVETTRTLLLHSNVLLHFRGGRCSYSIFLIPFFSLTNHFISFLLVFFVVLALFIFALLDRTNFLPKPQNASSWDTPDFKRVIVVIPLRLIATFSPLMLPSLRTHHSSPPLSLFLFLKSYPFPLSPHLMQCLLAHFRFIIAIIVSLFLLLWPRYLLTHFLSLWLLLPRLCLLLLTYPLLFGKTMVGEMDALHSNDTWDLVVLPSGKSTVGCRWVYTVKVGPDGQVDRLKTCLVGKGYTQVYGSSYGDTFSPVAKIAFVRLFLSMVAMRSWPFYQLDIKNAFLHGDLAEEVYMEQPLDFVAQGESLLVCRLCRSLYGLKQSPRAYTTDHSVFYHHNSSGQCIYLVVYVDDITITGSDHNDLGKLKYLLGIEIAQSSSGVVLSQRKYALDILEETCMLDCKPVDTLMDPNVKLIPGQEEPLGDLGRYRRLVGKLNYLTIIRPNISFPVSVVSQFLQSPYDSYWDAVIRILRYIKSTPGQDVLYKNRGHTQVVGYTDADWAGSPTDRRSTFGYCVFIRGNLISWKTEYRAMTLATCELIWLKHLL